MLESPTLPQHMRFSLVFAHDLAASALDRIAPLARVAAYGRVHAAGDADAAVAQLLGVAGGIAPFAALGAGLQARGAYVLRADPVTFVAGRDDVMLAGRVDDLSPQEASSLVDMLNRHFAGDAIAFHAPRTDAWFLTARESVPVETDALRPNEPIAPHLPRGPHGATWRRWLSEMQMLLHEHPVNRAREEDGRAQVTGIWMSGGGTLSPTVTARHAAIHAATSRAGDVVTGIARVADLAVTAPPAGFDALPRRADAMVVLGNVGDAQAIERSWLSPALVALERGNLDHVSIVAINGDARSYESGRPSWWRRMRARR